MSRVVLAMSGGVDSSVAAHLLSEQGHDVVGVFMRHGPASACQPTQVGKAPELPLIPPSRRGHKQGCCTARDAEDAARVAAQLGIPFYALELSADFERIMDYFADEYLRGRTPNPCVQCNNWIKFGRLFDYADSIGADYVATGHYARLKNHRRGLSLHRGADADKDQSYVLFGISPTLLPRMLLPVGEFDKSTIRQIAEERKLRVARKKDSQEICFVEPGKHADFVTARAGVRTAGAIVTTEGRKVGTHAGIEHFTIGQRRRLGVAMGEPYFVVRIDPAANQIIIGRHEELARTNLTARQANWFERPDGSTRCTAQIRYNSDSVACTVNATGPTEFSVQFDQPCYGVAPGQAVVCYDGDRVLGGGWID